MEGRARKPLQFLVALAMILVVSVASPGVAQEIQGPSVSIDSAHESRSGSITVHRFHDADRDGVQDDGEPDIEGWPIRLYRWDGTGLHKVAEGYTDSDGTVTFTDLVPTYYKVWEQWQKCWKPTTPPGMGFWDGGYYTVRYLGWHQALAVEFGNAYTCASPPQTCIDFEKTGPQKAYPGDTITYHYWVHNCGDIVLGGAHVYDPLLSDEPLWSGNLEPGQVREFDSTYTLPQDHCEGFPNHAWAVGQPPGFPAVRADDEWVVRIVCGPEPTTLILEPDVATNLLPDQVWRRFVATVLDQMGNPLVGVTVSFSTTFGVLRPPFTPTGAQWDLTVGSDLVSQQITGDPYWEGQTGAQGMVGVDIGSSDPGSAQLQAWVDDGDDKYTLGEVTDDPSTMNWVEVRTRMYFPLVFLNY